MIDEVITYLFIQSYFIYLFTLLEHYKIRF